MTKEPILLFYEDPYLKETNAIVIDVKDNIVWLDKTIFFAEKGGQVSDQGWINDIKVIDVRPEDYGHVLEKAPLFKVGEKVHLKLDWERRYRIMRLHSAAHLVYFAIKKVLGDVPVIGSHVGADKARIDIAFEGNVRPYLKDIQEIVNNKIRENKEIQIYTKGNLRIWKLDDWEIPCGGTHVRRTGEIGEVILKRVNLGKGKERIEIRLKEK